MFQGRYKALLVDKDNYLLELSRYIHLNPVRAGILLRPEDYQYSSMPYYTGKKKPPEWLNLKFVLEQFGRTLKEEQNAYKRFVYDGISRFLGSSVTPVAVSKVFSRTEEELTEQRGLKKDIDKIEKVLFNNS